MTSQRNRGPSSLHLLRELIAPVGDFPERDPWRRWPRRYFARDGPSPSGARRRHAGVISR